MQQRLRLSKSKDFSSVQREGHGWANRLLVLRVRENGLSVTRFGFSVGRRVGKSVVRNTVKRRLRAAAQSVSVRPGWDTIVIARSATAGCDYRTLRASLEQLLYQAGLLMPGSAEASQA